MQLLVMGLGLVERGGQLRRGAAADGWPSWQAAVMVLAGWGSLVMA